MFIPFITSRSGSKRLGRRKGGGGGGRGGGGKSSGGSGTSSGSSPSSSKGGSSGSSSSGKGSNSGKKTSVPLSSPAGNGQKSATAYGSGGGHTTIISAGHPFAGRSAGGGTRSQIFGTSIYGSGYPGVKGRGVVGRGFPFYYWPVVWPRRYDGSYLYDPEYGNSFNTSRVGGPMAEATFISNSTGTTFYVLSDNSTVSSLISSIDANCSSSLSSSSSHSPQPFNASVPGSPRPEQAIQYYRASSIVLTLDGYNNSAAFSSDPNVTAAALPSGIDTTLLDCLNQTIGLSAPLVNGAGLRWSIPYSPYALSVVCFVWWMLSSL